MVERAKDAGLVGINVIGVDRVTSERACDLANAYPGFLIATVGIQPNYVAQASEDDWNRIVELAQLPEVRAIGETGIDCYWDDAPLETQKTYFDRHIDLAIQTGLPMVIHMRESGPEIVAQLQKHSSLPPGINPYLIATRFGTGQALASNATTLGTLVSVLTAPIWLIIVTTVFGPI